MKHIIITFFFILFTSFVSAQQISEISVHKVYNDIINAIGNTNPTPPILTIVNSEKRPAVYDPHNSSITLEKKVLEICYSFNSDSLNALAYILAHELGHHYRGHGWMTQFASLDFSNEINKEEESNQQRIDDETEADIYAGFYAHIAGYNALSIADQFLDQIFKEYNRADSIPNYPSLTQRKIIINENKKQFETLKIIFNIANISMITGNYDYAQELYSHILKEGFTSREIYNNLGLSYIYEALDSGLEESLFKFLIPFDLDLDSRLETKPITRSFTTNNKAIDLFNNAIQEFHTALQLDPNYGYAKKNIYFTDIALSILEKKEKINLNIEDITDLENTCKFCVLGLNEIKNNKLRKSKSYFKKGSKSCKICAINLDFDNNKKSDQHSLTEKNINYDLDDCTYFRSSDCDDYTFIKPTKLCVNNEINFKLIQLKRRLNGIWSCVSIKEMNNNNLKNSLNINIGDNINDLVNHNNTKIIQFLNQKYIAVIDTDLIFLSEDEIITKWYITNRID